MKGRKLADLLKKKNKGKEILEIQSSDKRAWPRVFLDTGVTAPLIFLDGNDKTYKESE